jgi:hypothetical protein
MIVETGHVVEVDTVNLGAALTADHAAAVTTLTLDSVGAFNDVGEAFYLDPADDETEVVIAYTGKDEDADTLTLAAGLPDDLDADTYISVLPTSRARVAQVRFDDESRTIPAAVHHSLRDRLPEGVRDPGAEEAVEVTIDPSGDAVVTNVFDEDPVIDAGFISNQSAGFTAAADFIYILTSTWTEYFDWMAQQYVHPSVQLNPSGSHVDRFGRVNLMRPGVYLVIVTFRFDSNSTGVRQVRIVAYDADTATETVVGEVLHAASSSDLQIQCSALVTGGAGTTDVRLYVRQTSGTNVAIRALDDTDTHVQVVKLG